MEKAFSARNHPPPYGDAMTVIAHISHNLKHIKCNELFTSFSLTQNHIRGNAIRWNYLLHRVHAFKSQLTAESTGHGEVQLHRVI